MVITVTYTGVDGNEATLEKEIKAVVLKDMKPDKIKSEIVKAAEKARADSVDSDVQALLVPLLNVELEASP